MAAAEGMSPADWGTFSELVIFRHRVAPAVAEALAESDCGAPDAILAAIRAEARANGFAALAQKTESLRLAREMEATGVEAVWLKGWPLAEQLYGATGRRHSNDIDILVRADERAVVAEILERSGYVAAQEHRLRARLLGHPAVGAECKDVQYVNPANGLVVEMHWRTGHLPQWPGLEDIGEKPLPLPQIEGPAVIRVPGPLGQLVYLSAHGQGHLFGRLKWLLDIDRLAALRGTESLAGDLQRAAAADAGRVVHMALYLAHRVFRTEVPDGARTPPPRLAGWAEEILAEIADPAAAPGEIRARIGFYRWHFRMAETMSQRLGVFRHALWRKPRLGIAGLAHIARDADK